MRAREAARRDDAGFTLIETLVVLALGGIMMAIVAWGYRSYQMSTDHRGGTAQVVSTLRNAQSRSLSEARTYCVRFNSANRTLALYRYSCDTAAGGEAAGGTVDMPRGVGFANVAFTRADGSVTSDVYFYPRGSATAGGLDVTRSGSSRTYSVTVEGLTARVSSNA